MCLRDALVGDSEDAEVPGKMKPAAYEKQKAATRELIEFCHEHGNDTQNVSHLRSCLLALEQDDVRSALSFFEKIPRGGMGTFNDWLPPPVHKKETHESASATFDSLVAEWARSMKELESRSS